MAMIHLPKSLKVSSTLSFVLAAVGLVAGCTIATPATTEPGLAPSGPAATPTPPTADGGAAAPSAVVAGGCDFGEPNDTRDQSKAINLNTSYQGLCVSSPDHTDELDFFEFTAPSDVAGGVVEVQVSNVKNDGLVEIIVTAVADNGVIFDSYQTDRGASSSGWLTVSPGAKYRIQVGRFGGAGDRFAYDLSTKYTAINDAYESNNRKQDATSISVNTPITASAAAHSPNAALVDGDDEDWFTVTVASGLTTIKMTNVAADYMCDVEVLDASGVAVTEKYQTTPGADCVLDPQNLTAGSYYLRLHHFGGVPVRGAANKPVAAFELQSYSLVVAQ